MGSFLKHQKTMKMFVHVYNTMLLVLGINFTVFLNHCKPSMMIFGVRCNRVFFKFPGRSLLWTTTVVHDIIYIIYIIYNAQTYVAGVLYGDNKSVLQLP